MLILSVLFSYYLPCAAQGTSSSIEEVLASTPFSQSQSRQQQRSQSQSQSQQRLSASSAGGMGAAPGFVSSPLAGLW